MQFTHPAYPHGPINVGPLETALFEAVAERTKKTPQDVAVALFGLHGIPSDAFYAAYDNEVGDLVARFNETITR